MVNNYEGLVIIDSKLSDDKRNALIEKFSKMAGGNVKVDKWGIKKFAYPINYKNEGFYMLMTFSGDNTVVEKIVKLMNITDGIVRHMFIKLDDKKKTAKKPAKKQPVKEPVAEVAKTEKPAVAVKTVEVKPVAKVETKPVVKTAEKPAAKAVAKPAAKAESSEATKKAPAAKAAVAKKEPVKKAK